MVGVFVAIILIFVMMGDSVKKAEKKVEDERKQKLDDAVEMWKKDYYERHPEG